jgi:DNA-binding NarL/FixJ family response regulator
MSRRDPVTVVVGSFEPLLRIGLLHALGKDHRFRVFASDLDEVALERAVMQWRPRVAILGESVEFDLLRRLKAAQPVTGLVVLAHASVRLSGTMLVAAGVSYLARTATEDDVLSSVYLAGQGIHTSPYIDDSRVRRRYASAVRMLTRRETEVLAYLSEGRTNPEIAAEMHISRGTVRTHVARIFRKLDVSDRKELIGFVAPIPD